jgi:uncharacterized protein (DUF1015 family)
MAQIKPFQAVRPSQETAHRVAALPYDVYNRREAKAEVEREPMSFLKIDRAETQFPDSVDTYDDCVYDKAKQLLEQMQQEGIYISDDRDAYYIYQLTMDGRAQTGIVACAGIDDYQDRIRHVDTLGAQTGPIFLAYRSREEINRIVNQVTRTQEPLYDFTSSDGIGHTVWEICQADLVDRLQKAFESMDEIYIADGHHRAASAVKVGLKRRRQHPDYDGSEEFNFFLSVLFPDDQLMIMDYNRCVKDLNGLTSQEFLERVQEIFSVQPIEGAASPQAKGEFTMYLDGTWYRLKADAEKLAGGDPVKSLDVSVLQDYLLEPVLGITDPRTDERIDFVGGIRGLKELERRVGEDMRVAFAMYPTSIGELFAVADAGMLMPPKSTWFEPKLRSGLFIHKIED